MNLISQLQTKKPENNRRSLSYEKKVNCELSYANSIWVKISFKIEVTCVKQKKQ
jgi:hypothetical protein